MNFKEHGYYWVKYVGENYSILIYYSKSEGKVFIDGKEIYKNLDAFEVLAFLGEDYKQFKQVYGLK